MAKFEILEGTIGDTNMFTITVVVYGTSTPVDISSADMWFTAKHQLADADADAVFQKETGSGITLTTPASGIATVTISPSDTASLTRTTSLWYDVQLKQTNGRITTVQQGLLRLQLGATVVSS